MLELGYRMEEDDLVRLFERFKLLADKKKGITDADLEALVRTSFTNQRSISSWTACR